MWEICLALTNHPGQLNLTIPLWVSARVVTLCGWGEMTGMFHDLWQVKLYDSLLNTYHT